jgi:hypothetical protein
MRRGPTLHPLHPRPVFPREQPRTPSFHTSSKRKTCETGLTSYGTWLMGPEHIAGRLPPSMYTCRIISTSSLPFVPDKRSTAPPLPTLQQPSPPTSPRPRLSPPLPLTNPPATTASLVQTRLPILSLLPPRCPPSSGCPRPLVECPPSNSNTPKPHHRAAIQSRASPQQPCLPSPELLEQSSGEASSSMPATLDTPVLTVDVGLIHKVDTRNVENLFSMWTGELPSCTGSAPRPARN